MLLKFFRKRNRVQSAAKRRERRLRARRVIGDRRDAVRFEENNPPRRRGFGRRKPDKVWDKIRERY